MRKKIIYSSVFVLLAGAGGLAYHGTRRSPAAASTTTTAASSSSDTARITAHSPAPALDVAAGPQVDRATMSKASTSGQHFPDTPIGRALDQHLLILVDVSPGADDRKAASLAELRKHPGEASQALVDAYRAADPADGFGRWLLSTTLGELDRNEGYRGLAEIASSEIPAKLRNTDRELANESAIRQSATEGLAALAHGGNADAEHDLLALALRPPSGDDAVRTVAIKGYLAAGADYEARVQALKAQLPSQYHDVITLTVTQPEDPVPPDYLPAGPNNGG